MISFSNNVNSQLSLRNYTGGLNLQDIDNALNVASLDFNSGSLTLDSTVTDGTIVIRGIVGGLTDNSGPNVTIAQAGRVDPVAAQTSNFDGTVHIDALNGTSGTDYPLGLHDSPVDNTADALAIAANFGIEGIKIDGALPLTSGTFSPLNIVGNTALRDSVTVSTLPISARVSPS